MNPYRAYIPDKEKKDYTRSVEVLRKLRERPRTTDEEVRTEELLYESYIHNTFSNIPPASHEHPHLTVRYDGFPDLVELGAHIKQQEEEEALYASSTSEYATPDQVRNNRYAEGTYVYDLNISERTGGPILIRRTKKHDYTDKSDVESRSEGFGPRSERIRQFYRDHGDEIRPTPYYVRTPRDTRRLGIVA